MMNEKDKMHPEDMRNLIIFGLLSLVIWIAYQTYIIGPQKQAIEKAKKARAEMILNDPELLEPVKTVSRMEAIRQAERVTFDNGEVYGTISLTGGRIDDLSLRHYHETLEKKSNIVLFSPVQTKKPRYLNYGWVATDKNIKTPDAQSQWMLKGNELLTEGAPVTLVWDNGQGIRFEREIALDDEYLFTIKQRVYNQSGRDITLYPYALIVQTGVPDDHFRTWISHEGPMGFIGGALEQMYYAAMEGSPDERREAERGWIGISDKYWLTALIPPQDQITKFRFKHTKDPVKKERNKYQTDFTGPPMLVANGQSSESSYHMYAGVKKVLTLEDYQKELQIDNFDLAVDFGWFWFLTYPLFFGLHYLGLWTGNVGVAIVIMTIVLRSLVFPLTNKSYKSFAKMKVVAPQITELRDKYSDDKEKLQQSIVELYQREGVNPLSGCLPMIAQIPIFFAFYKVLFSTVEIRHAPFFGWIQDLSKPDPTSVFNLFGVIPWDPPQFLMIGAWPCIMLLAMLMQRKLNPPPQDEMQRQMMAVFPFVITYVMSGFASGLVIYWTLSAILGIIQQTIIMRSLGVPIYIFEKDKFEEEMEKKIEEGPAVHPLIEMAEEEAEKALFGEDEQVEDIKPPKPKKKKKKK